MQRQVSKDRERERRRVERKVQTLEEEVARLEADLAAVRGELAGDHGGNWGRLHELADKERALDELLTKRMAEWEAAAADLANLPGWAGRSDCDNPE